MAANRPPKPTVLIVGAGLGGVTLGLILEAAGVPYMIFERAIAVKPLGSALSLGPTVFPLFKQLGIYDEILARCKNHKVTQDHDEARRSIGVIDWTLVKEMGGYGAQIIARPVLYDILLSKIPPSKIQMGKKLVSFTDDEQSVTIHFADGTTHSGHVLVGADGAYSTVRSNMHTKLKAKGKLSKEDEGGLPYRTTCLVGQTEPLNPEEFPELEGDDCTFYSVMGIERPYTRATFTSKENTNMWMVVHQLGGVESSAQKLKEGDYNAEWGPEAAEVMCKEVRHLPVPGGKGKLTMGDLIDKTPKHLISKVMLEEKVFETWYDDRIVLLGDACHKFNPAGGAGAANAIMDAICLGNWLNVASASMATREMCIMFHDYQTERYPIAKDAFESSQLFASMQEKTFKAAVLRYVVRNMPEFFRRKWLSGTMDIRPQLSFLPYAKDGATVPAREQYSLIHTTWILEGLAEHDAKAAVRDAKLGTQEATAGLVVAV
ncbi:hypothetical protein BG004_001524 [Podila humilis]|nr:hypothetical protein BG004_001524 [Podila humilis]